MMTPNTYICPLFLEPVKGAGDRFTVGAIVRDESVLTARRIIRDDSLRAMYGKKGVGLQALIDRGLSTLAEMLVEDRTLSSVPKGVFGLTPGATRHIYASSINDALRTCVLMYSSLGSLEQWDDEDENDDTAEETNKRFFTEVRDLVLSWRPEMKESFGKMLPLYEGGLNNRFGFYNRSALLNFGVLAANRQPAGIKDAQARLWQLKCGKEYTRVRNAALIFGVPNEEDPTIGSSQRATLRRNIHEIEMQADHFELRFFPVHSVNEAADKVISLAA